MGYMAQSQSFDAAAQSRHGMSHSRSYVDPHMMQASSSSAGKSHKAKSPGVSVGQRIGVVDPYGVPRLCRALNINGDSVFVHYEGFDSHYDEWVSQRSGR